MKRPLVYYWQSSIDYIVNFTEWKYIGKVALVIVPVLFFTAWYWVVKGIWLGTEFINKKGDKFLETFLK